MSRFRQFDLSGIKTVSIKERKSKVGTADFAKPFDPSGGSFKDFLNSLPSILISKDFKEIVNEIISARGRGLPVIVMMGAHVIKVGCSPLLIDLMQRGFVTAVAMNSASAIHDVETAMWGVTSEDVAGNLTDGSFGMWKETGDFINNTLAASMGTETGYGEALGDELIRRNPPELRHSILAAACRLNIPATVHAAIGTDIVHQQPTMNGSVTGEMSFRDFKLFCSTVGLLVGGGVVLNFGSAVILPEVFLKALTIVRNTGIDARGFITANFDMLQHYRPTMNVVQRPTQDGGRGYSVTGHHELMIPLLCAAIRSESV